jgi:hypothetical protein
MLARPPRQPPCALERLAQQKLDLGVHGAQLGVRPAVDRVVDLGIQAKQKGFFLRHAFRCTASCIQATGVDHRFDAAIAAKHHQQIAHHGDLALFVPIRPCFSPPPHPSTTRSLSPALRRTGSAHSMTASPSRTVAL